MLYYCLPQLYIKHNIMMLLLDVMLDINGNIIMKKIANHVILLLTSIAVIIH
jgi:hypothetical protein